MSTVLLLGGGLAVILTLAQGCCVVLNLPDTAVVYPVGLSSQAPKAFILELEGDLTFLPGNFRLLRFH